MEDLLLWASVLVVTLITILWLLGWENMWLIWHTLPRDLYGMFIMSKILKRMKKMRKEEATVIKIFEGTVSRFPARPMFKFQGRVWTFSQVNDEANSIAAYFQSKGFQKGDCVALLMENSPSLVIYWLGLAKIGCVSALVNFNQRSTPLSHSLNICGAKAVVCSQTLYEVALQPVREALPQGDKAPSIYIHHDVIEEPKEFEDTKKHKERN